MSNSTHKVEVFKIDHIEKHPNADRLSLVYFYGYQCIIRTDDFKVGDLACYVPPDNIMPDKPEYEFLGSKKRIKAQKLRGTLSQGLVLKAPPEAREGDDVASLLGITHYIPNVQYKVRNHGRVIAPPPFEGSVYDIDSWYRYGHLLVEGESVEITEKIHGANMRVTYQNGRLHVGSRRLWRDKDEDSIYWRVIVENPWIKRLAVQNPGAIIYGELYGWVQDLHYGAKPGEIHFRVFDILKNHQFVSIDTQFDLIRDALDLNWFEKLLLLFWIEPKSRPLWVHCHVPLHYQGPYSTNRVKREISGNSVITGADNIREGIVIKPVLERWDPKIGRVILKAVSPEYLEKSK